MPKFNFTLILLLFTLSLSGQIEQTIYYDANWKGVANKTLAKYYRIVSYDSKSIWRNKVVAYYKTGGKLFETEYDEFGKLNGSHIQYYENGKIKTIIEYQNGKAVEKWYTECDEFDNCQKILFDGFMTSENINDWEIEDNNDYKCLIIPGTGYLMATKNNGAFAQLIYYPIDIVENFSIETTVQFKSGDKNSIQGLIYGFKDWNNYYYFKISTNGYFTVGAVSDGISLEYISWAPSTTINKDFKSNLIQINKVSENIFFSVNGKIVGTEEFYTFKGNKIGFYLNSNVSNVLYKNLTIKQNIRSNFNTPSLVENSKWTGNGSGFFIDARGYIITNYHVIENASEIEIDLIRNEEKRSYSAKVISVDKLNDLAIVKINDVNFIPYQKLPYNFKTQISDIGSNVFALGYPMALSGMGEEVKFTDGKISSKTGYEGDITNYQISVPVQPGNSGGPLFDYDGNIIGVISAKILAADNVSYAIKSNYLQSLIEVAPEKLTIPNDASINKLTLTEKIKLLSDYVVLIKIK